MGAFASALKGRANPGLCRFGAMVAKHADDEDKAWIDNPKTQHRPIAEEASKAWGEYVSDHTVRSHRNRDCICYRGQAE